MYAEERRKNNHPNLKKLDPAHQGRHVSAAAANSECCQPQQQIVGARGQTLPKTIRGHIYFRASSCLENFGGSASDGYQGRRPWLVSYGAICEAEGQVRILSVSVR